MTTCRSAFAPLLLCSAALTGVTHASQVWVVDDDGGAGVDFTEIQPAIAAASAGDVILVKAGHYGAFTLGKGLTIVGEADEIVRVDGPWTVATIPAGQLAVLRSLRTAAPLRQGLVATSCTGSVWIEDCVIKAADGSTEVWEEATNHGIELHDCEDVVVARSNVVGGHGANFGFFGEPYPGGAAIRAFSSTIAVLECDLEGGNGADGPIDDWYSGGHGGSGVHVVDSTAIVAGGSVMGGWGGWGDADYDIWVGKQCGDGGDGGSGVLVDHWHPLLATSLPSTVAVRDQFVSPGAGGGSYCGVPGSVGQLIAAGGPIAHTIWQLDHGARGFFVNSPVRGGNNARLTFQGEDGDVALALVGSQTTWLDLGQQPSPYILGNLLAVLGPFPIGPAGQTIQLIPIPTQDPTFGGATLPLEAVVLEVESGALTVAPPSALTILNAAL